MPSCGKSTERVEIALLDEEELFKNYRNHCKYRLDSYASWDSNFKHLIPLFKVEDLASNIVELLPYKRWHDEHLVITGVVSQVGNVAIRELLDEDSMIRLRHLTFETNGTEKLVP